MLRATDEQRVSLTTLRNLQFPLPNGRTVPLGQFATLDFEQEFPLIWRRDGVPTLTVQADVAPGRAARRRDRRARPGDREAEREPAEALPHRRGRHGRGERRSRRPRSIAVVPVMLLHHAHLSDDAAAELQRLFLVLSVVPLGLIGVVAALLVFRQPLGFVAILGILALIGMITKNAVILIDQIEAERARARRSGTR